MLYIKLFHGRLSPDEKLNDWGFDGPILGPFQDVAITYASHIRAFGGCLEEADVAEIGFNEDMLYYNGSWYGDATILSEESIETMNNDLIEEWDESKGLDARLRKEDTVQEEKVREYSPPDFLKISSPRMLKAEALTLVDEILQYADADEVAEEIKHEIALVIVPEDVSGDAAKEVTGKLQMAASKLVAVYKSLTDDPPQAPEPEVETVPGLTLETFTSKLALAILNQVALEFNVSPEALAKMDVAKLARGGQ